LELEKERSGASVWHPPKPLLPPHPQAIDFARRQLDVLVRRKELILAHRHQEGYIWRINRSWYGRWWEDVLRDGQVVRRQRSRKLAEYGERYRTVRDVRPLLNEILLPVNERRTRPESTLLVSQFVESCYLPFVEENFKPSTVAGYNYIWEKYISPRLNGIVVRDFRTVDAANLLAEVHRSHKVGRTMLKHVKSFLSGVFTYAKNQGVLDGVNPVRDAAIPRKAATSKDTHAATLEEVLAIMDVLGKTGEQKARAAVALMFFAGLRPGEARGVCWEDFDGKRFLVCRSVWNTYTTSTKTEGSAKPVPVIEPLRTILFDLRKADGNPASGPILRGPAGKPLDLHNLANRVLRPILQTCAVCQRPKRKHGKSDHSFRLDESRPRWHGWYALRRGVATAVVALSKDSFAAKGLLRHSSVSTTERHYIKDVSENTAQAMKLLESLCGEGMMPRTAAVIKPN
jgi:integrase